MRHATRGVGVGVGVVVAKKQKYSRGNKVREGISVILTEVPQQCL